MIQTSIENQVSRYWWLVALRGVIAIILGILTFVWPGISLVVLIAFFGAYMFVDGIVALVQAVRFRHERDRWPALLTEGILGILVGLATYFWPGLTALAWVITIAAWAIVTGILEIVAAVRLRQIVQNEIFLLLSGVVSIVLGILFLFLPSIGLLTAVYFVGAYAIVYGVLLLSLAFRLRKGARPGTPVGVQGA
jgi:uncharacterized membrane protein HdeD (DUF308 family)